MIYMKIAFGGSKLEFVGSTLVREVKNKIIMTMTENDDLIRKV